MSDNDLVAKLAGLVTENDQLRTQKNIAYHERDLLVAALSKLFPSHLLIHPLNDETWDVEWRTIICVHLPTGQAMWHIHDSERCLFTHLDGMNVTICHGWDGHTTEEKYERLTKLKPYETTWKWFDNAD